MNEARAFGKTWWCRGGGAAVVMLLAVVSIFRAPRDGIFWAAVGFFLAHAVLTVRRYQRERKARAVATVTRHHPAQQRFQYNGLVFSPTPANSLLMPMKITVKDLQQQTKNVI
jgi:hypothetical protein